jgi:hypothetical protein
MLVGALPPSFEQADQRCKAIRCDVMRHHERDDRQACGG